MSDRRLSGTGGAKKRDDLSPEEAFAKAVSHPVRVEALKILSERTASPKQIALELATELSNVSYHVTVLHGLGLIELVEEEAAGGSIAHFYRVTERALTEDRHWRQLDPKVRAVRSGQLIEALVGEAAASLETGLFDARSDRHLTRTPLILDEEGWRTVIEIHQVAQEAILKEQAAAAARIDDSDRAIHAVAALLCFEVPPSQGRAEEP